MDRAGSNCERDWRASIFPTPEIVALLRPKSWPLSFPRELVVAELALEGFIGEAMWVREEIKKEQLSMIWGAVFLCAVDLSFEFDLVLFRR